jgi:hypothetical protein
MTAATKPPSRRPPRTADARPAKRRPSGQPYLRFYHSERLRDETLAVLSAIEEASDPLTQREALADLAAKLMDSGFDYYLLRALRLANVGFIVEQSVHIAMAGASRVLASVTRNVLLRMDRGQLLAVCAHVRQLMQ